MTSLSRYAVSALLVASVAALTGAAHQAKTIQLGMSKTFFQDRSSAVIDIATNDFKDVLKETTGLEGKLASGYAAEEIAKKVVGKELDFGIFFAHEFAWLQKKHPTLQPLMISINKRHELRVHIIVHKNSPAKSLADLRGKKFDMPIGTIEPSRLYVERNTDKDKGPAGFFSSIQKSASQDEAMNEVARGKVDGAVVDTTELEAYQSLRGPVFKAHLRVLQQSDPFPSALVAYQPGNVDEAVLKQFREGLLKAHTIKSGREMMKEWNIDAFEPIPKDYAKSLAEVLKAYPPPASLR